MISDNYQRVLANIAEAAHKAGRDPKDITLISVSKTKPVSLLQEAYDAGARFYGENRVQELVDKIPQLPSDIQWHLIGTLQKNKVKYIVDQVAMIHSVDSVALAAQIEKEAAKKNCEVNILLEVNVAQEATKSGFLMEEVYPACLEISVFPHVHICGLMTVAPFVEDPEENRMVFRNLYHLGVDIQNKNVDNVSMCEYSMGMTGDYMVAVEEGATMVRVGTGIFGERDYSI